MLGNVESKKKKRYTIIHYLNYPNKYNKETSEEKEIDLVTITFLRENF